MISIISYEEKYQPGFKSLNLGWLDKYNLTEQHDLDILDDPQGEVIDPGGCIFLAMDGEKVVGTAGLAKENEAVYELVKMSVDLNYHGKGLGKLLLERCVEEAKKLKATKIILYSSSKLKTALAMYEKYGFTHVDVTDSPFLTADVKMELLCTT